MILRLSESGLAVDRDENKAAVESIGMQLL